MTDEKLEASITIAAPAEAVFAVLADTARHPAIDGTGRVIEALGNAPLSHAGQVFRMAMYHPDHPDGTYVTANRVTAFDPPRAISWAPGPDVVGDAEPESGGWIWRYDLAPVDPSGAAPSGTDPSGTEVTLTYDWSAVRPSVREYIAFPPFPVEHLTASLQHLAELVTQRGSRS